MKIPALLLVAVIAPRAAHAQGAPFAVPAWAFPSPPSRAVPADSITLHHVPRSTRAFTVVQVGNRYNPVDWHPETHPAMPASVARGEKPRLTACAYCHLPDGAGRPENAVLAGLPAEYIMRQVADIRSRARGSAWSEPFVPMQAMRDVADSARDEEVAEAARYFSRLKARPRFHVTEATIIPRAIPALGLHFAATDGTTEPLGERLIEVPVDAERHELRDAGVGFVAYVPRGSIARGRALATKGFGGDVKSACTTCHGPRLRGVALVPPIAGRSPSYILRQLMAFRTGTRATPASAPMNAVAAQLSLADMIGAAAYAGSQTP